MRTSIYRLACAALLTAAGAAAAQAAVVRIDEDSFVASAGLITFSEFPLGSVNPTYSPADYGGEAGSPIIFTGGYFLGQSLSVSPEIDCPGAAPTACVVGSPTAGLALDPDAPSTVIVRDGATPTWPVLSGSPLYNGPIALLFSEDQAAVGFTGGYFDAVGSTGITAFTRSGSLLGTVVNESLGIEFLGLASASGAANIAGVFLELIGAELAGFTIDNVRFGQITALPPVIAPIPLPGALPLMLAGLGAMGLLAARRRQA